MLKSLVNMGLHLTSTIQQTLRSFQRKASSYAPRHISS
jgi:hypothetical protein